MFELLNVLSAFGLSVSAGLNAYIPLLVVSLLAKFTDLIQLKSPWDALTSWWTIGILLFLSLIEFFADKIPAVNHINDAIQTIVRPTAGAIVFAASAHVITDIHPVLSLALGLLVAGGVHTVKAAAVRPAVTATTAGTGKYSGEHRRRFYIHSYINPFGCYSGRNCLFIDHYYRMDFIQNAQTPE